MATVAQQPTTQRVAVLARTGSGSLSVVPAPAAAAPVATTSSSDQKALEKPSFFRLETFVIALLIVGNIGVSAMRGAWLPLITSVFVSVLHGLYGVVWLRPASFIKRCQRRRMKPFETFVHMALILRALQLSTLFLNWAWSLLVLGAFHWSTFLIGAVCCAVGQALNVYVFQTLGKEGVFYGNRFGKTIPWVSSWIFDTISHPQYVGCVLSYVGVWMLSPSLNTFHPCLSGVLCYIFTGLTEHSYTVEQRVHKGPRKNRAGETIGSGDESDMSDAESSK